MDPRQNVSLAKHSTMGLGGPAAYLVEVTGREGLKQALSWAKAKQLPSIMIGEGSNIVWGDDGYPGLVIVDKIRGYEVDEQNATDVYLTLGGGEPWDDAVGRTVADGLTGIEALSLIPGTVGGTPVQNVGAYGQEISQTLVSVEAYDAQVDDFVKIAVSDCAFGYRTSRFKTTDHGRFYITAITLHLTKGQPKPPFYGSVQKYFDEQAITDYTSAALRQAVIAIRKSKLPDPATVHNSGSFFSNPIVDNAKLAELTKRFEHIPRWPAKSGGVKLSGAWLVEHAGFKDYHDKETGMATWPRQPLVLVNERAKSTANLLKFKQKITEAVQSKFGITLEQEPELLP